MKLDRDEMDSWGVTGRSEDEYNQNILYAYNSQLLINKKEGKEGGGGRKCEGDNSGSKG